MKFIWNLEDIDRHKGLYVKVWNRGSEMVNITRVELIYLPDETLGLTWIERRLLQPQKMKFFVWYGWYNETIDLPYIRIENSPERLALFNLLQEGENEAILEIIVETTKAIYTFNPQKSHEWTNPTSIEEKEKPEPETKLRIAFWTRTHTNIETPTYNVTYRLVYIDVVNDYLEQINVSRVELIYLPDETLGLIWVGFYPIEGETRKQFQSDFSSYTEPSEERLAFFNLLLRNVSIENNEVRIEVETDEAIYIYYPLNGDFSVEPTTIEEK